MMGSLETLLLRQRKPMKFYRLRTDRKLYGFGDRCSDLPILGVPLGDQQQRVIKAAGAQLEDVSHEAEIDDSKYVIFDEHLLLTQKAIEYINRTARHADRSLRFCLLDNTLNRRFVLPSSADAGEYLRFPIYYRDRKNTDCADQVIPQRVYTNTTNLPQQIVPGGKYHLDQCDTIIAAMDTPFHLLQANTYMNLARGLWLRKLAPWSRKKTLPNMNSRSYSRSLKLLNRFGKRCRIHSTAVVEGAVLGDGVTIGAHAIVRLSHIGSGSTIDDQASVTYSVLGKNNYIANKNHLAFCLTYDGVFLIHGPYQFSIFGRDSAVFATINCDVRMDQKTIRIDGPDGIIDSQQHLLGVAYGHNVKVAGGNIMAPGQIVPNGHVQLPPDFIVNQIQ